MDFKELSGGRYLLVVYDDYSRYPVVEVITSLSSKTVIPHLKKIFAEFGIPETVRSDNGPPFNSKEFGEFAQRIGFTHCRITPLWPKANGEVERFMRTLKKTIESAKPGKRSHASYCVITVQHHIVRQEKLLQQYSPTDLLRRSYLTVQLIRSTQLRSDEITCKEKLI